MTGSPHLRSSQVPSPQPRRSPASGAFSLWVKFHLSAQLSDSWYGLELPSTCASSTRLFSSGGEIMFRLERAEYDRETQRAYVELRAPDDDGGEAVTAIIFSFRTTATLSKQQIKEDIVRKARHLLKRASLAAEFV